MLLVVMVLMNTYPLLVSEDLVFRSKHTALQSSVTAINAAVTGLDELTEENAAAAMAAVELEGISRAIVTDPYGKVLYDTRDRLLRLLHGACGGAAGQQRILQHL